MNDQYFLNIWKQEIIKKYDDKPASDWTTKDFEKLCEEIELSTKSHISITTLKRIWGKVKYENTPNESTLDTLVNYIGYKSWWEFKKVHTKEESSTQQAIQTPFTNVTKPTHLPKKQIKRQRLILFSLCVLLIIALITIQKYGLFKQTEDKVTPSNNYLYSFNNIADTTPVLVKFGYSLPEKYKNGAKILSFGTNGAAQIIGLTGKSEYLYTQAGYYNAKIFYNDQNIARLGVHLYTKQWQTVIQRKDTADRFLPLITFDKGRLGTTPNTLRQYGIDTALYYVLVFRHYMPFNIDIDNFDFETVFHFEPYQRENICGKYHLTLIGEHERHILQLESPQCYTPTVYNQFGEVYLNPDDEKAQNFQCLAVGKNTLTINVKQKKLNIYHNNKLIYHIDYQKNTGILKGIEITGRRTSISTDYIIIKDIRQEKIVVAYKDNF